MSKQLMIRQRYVPATCTLDESLAFMLIVSEIREGRDPCAGCNMDRSVCHGRPRAMTEAEVSDRDPVRALLYMRDAREKERVEDERRRAQEMPVHGIDEEIL